ncbi:epoxide hydrolase N-terminal domain-containing protein [Streptomyces sp. P5_D11]
MLPLGQEALPSCSGLGKITQQGTPVRSPGELRGTATASKRTHRGSDAQARTAGGRHRPGELRRLVTYWASDCDWRAHEATINSAGRHVTFQPSGHNCVTNGRCGSLRPCGPATVIPP